MSTPVITSLNPDLGNYFGGNTITINGSGFGSGLPNIVAITFGKVGVAPSQITYISDTRLQVVVPAPNISALTKGVAQVSVEVMGGTVSNTEPYTYTAPVLNTVQPKGGSIAGGNMIAIDGQYFTGASQVQVGSNYVAASSFRQHSDRHIVLQAPPAVGGNPASDTQVIVYVNNQPSNAGSFSYDAPEILSLSSSSGPSTGGLPLTITGKHLLGASLVQFGTSGAITANNFISITDTQISILTPAGAQPNTTVHVTVEVAATFSAKTASCEYTFTPPSPMLITFTNDTNSKFTTAQILVGFFDGTAPGVPGTQPATAISYAVPNATFNIVNKSDSSALLPLQLSTDFSNGWPDYGYPFTGNWYALSDLPEGVLVHNFSGRIYVVYGNPAVGWQFPTVANGGWGYTPNCADPSAIDFYIQYDQMELTYNGCSNDVADLTSINYWAIPMTLITSLKGTIVNTITGTVSPDTGKSIYTALNALCTDALVPGTTFATPVSGVTYLAQPGRFTRFIGPVSYAAAAPPVSPYDNFNEYITYLITTFGPGTTSDKVVPGLGAGIIATVSGEFGGSPCTQEAYPQPFQAQAYNLTATIDAAGDITLTGTVGPLSGVTIVMTNSALTSPPGIYGGNVACTIKSAPYPGYPGVPGNDVYGWLVADLYLGLNIGAVGSTATPNSGPMVGSLPSNKWYTLTGLYSALQTDADYYNQWSATMQPMSQAYNFAYSDRLKNYGVQISLAPGAIDTLNIALSDI